MKSISPQKNGNKSLKITLVVIVSLLILAAGTLFTLEALGVTHLFSRAENSSSTNTQQSNSTDKTTNEDKGSSPVPGVNTDKTTEEIPQSKEMAISLSGIESTDTNVKVSAKITNPGTNGICAFTFTKDGAKPVAKSIETSNDTCSVNITSQEFEMIGPWNISARYFSNNAQATTTGMVSIK